MFTFRRVLFLSCALLLCVATLGTPVRAQTAGFVYVSNEPAPSSGQPGSILGYAINVQSGALTTVPGSPFQAYLTGSATLAATPSGRFLYAPVVTGYNTYGIAGYSIDGNTGALTPISGSPFTLGSTVGRKIIAGLAVDGAGQFVYAYDGYNGQFWVFTIDANSGALTLLPGAPFSDYRLQGNFFAMDPTGQFFYFFNTQYGTSGQIQVFQFNPNAGSFSAIAGTPFTIPQDTSSGFRGGPSANWATTDPGADLLYVGDSAQKDIWTYAYDSTTGALNLTSNSPMHIPHSSGQFTVHPSGRFGYLSTPYPDSANCANYYPYTSVNAPESVFAYSVAANSGALSPVANSPMVAAGYLPNQIAIDPSGRFAYVLNLQGYNFDTNSSNVSAYTIDPQSGALTQILGSPFAAGASAASVVVTASSQ